VEFKAVEHQITCLHRTRPTGMQSLPRRS
jgi:hypothetical protein